MDEYNVTSISNRDDAIPVIQFPRLEDETPSPSDSSQDKPRKRDAFKKEADKLREKLQDVNSQYKSSQGSVQERLFNTYASFDILDILRWIGEADLVCVVGF